MLCKNTCPQSSLQSLVLVDTAVGRVCFLSSVKHNNRQVCALFQKDVVFRVLRYVNIFMFLCNYFIVIMYLFSCMCSPP